MNESGQNFDQLKKLLKLKQHEVPPPGFFNDFSREVISRIEDNQVRSRGSLAERLEEQAPWLVTFLRLFEAKPGVVGGFATSLCLLLLFGVVLAERSETGPQGPMFNTAAAEKPATQKTSPLAPAAELGGNLASNEGGIAISTNASLQPVATLFGQGMGNSLFQPAGFAPAR